LLNNNSFTTGNKVIRASACMRTRGDSFLNQYPLINTSMMGIPKGWEKLDFWNE